jgi:hypothetical protein
MIDEPRLEGDYTQRQVEAAHRVLVDVGITELAADWRARCEDPIVREALRILREKFETVDHYGPKQQEVFHGRVGDDEGAMLARRAFELVGRLLSLL